MNSYCNFAVLCRCMIYDVNKIQFVTGTLSLCHYQYYINSIYALVVLNAKTNYSHLPCALHFVMMINGVLIVTDFLF